MRVLHQAGHNTKWNRDSFLEYGAGEGLIFSPVHSDCKNITQLDDSIKRIRLDCVRNEPQSEPFVGQAR